MIEAKSIEKGYFVLNEFANSLDRNTKLSSSNHIEDIFQRMGGTINYYNYNENNDKKFVNIYGSNNFHNYLINGLDKDFKRLLIIQSLGHYILHGEGGKKVCRITSDKNSKVYQEGFLFTLSLLIPDELFLEIYKRHEQSYLAALFRVPKFAIESKQKIINKIYLNKE